MSPRANIDRCGSHRPRGAEDLPQHAVRRAAARPILYVPNVGAQPEPPVNFNTQRAGARRRAEPGDQYAETPLSVNLNTYVPKEPAPADADDVAGQAIPQRHRGHRCRSPRQGLPGCEPRRQLRDPRHHRHWMASSPRSMPTTRARRFQTGNLPSGVVMARRRPARLRATTS